MNFSVDQNDPMQQEWAAWQDLCLALQGAGAVTGADLRSPITAKDTPGQRLLAQIRAWGNALLILEVAKLKEVARASI